MAGRGDLSGLVAADLFEVLDAAEEGFCIYVPVREGDRIVDLTVAYINRTGARSINRAPAEMVGERLSVLFPTVFEERLAGYAKVIETGMPFSRTVHFDDGIGSGYFDVRAQRVGGVLVLCFGNLSQTTVSRPHSRAEVLLRSALDAAFDGFSLLTAVRDETGAVVDFVIDYVNEAGARLGDLSPAEVVGGRLAVLSPPVVTSGVLRRYARVAETGRAYRAELSDPDSDAVWDVKAVRVADEVIALSFREVSERVRQQRQVEASEAQARLAADRMAALQTVTAALARANTVADVFGVMTAQRADWAGGEGLLVLLRDDDRMVLRHQSGFAPELIEFASDVSLDGDAGIAVAARLGTALFYGSTDAYFRAHPSRSSVRPFVNLNAWAIAPLMSAGRVVGGMIIGYREEHEFDDGEQDLIVSLAELYAQALERARLFEAQRSIAVDLQRALLPTALPQLDGARYAARYLPWTEAADVGGDWYDVICLDEETVGIAIGDVVGHSLQAAATMGLIRNALRAYALERHSPTTVLERTNRLLALTESRAVATCCYIELHLAERMATVVLAGHLPPVLLGNRGAAAMGLRTGPPLGVVAAAAYTDTTVLLPAGSSLLLYTDGLVEDRRYDIERGLRDLCKAAVEANTDDPQKLVDRILAAEVGPHPRSDDAALLALTVDAGPATGVAPTATRRFASEARSVPSARRFAGDVLTAWGLTGMIDVTRLLLGEVVTNAVQHTVGEVRVRLVRRPSVLRVQVFDSSDRRPDVRTADADSESGRGLLIVETLADAWGFDSIDITGKVVWFELALPSGLAG